ncbi:hypothetical protein [Nocardia arizonensis]|uniref:hypothetical protein n=1 Tax=Nocardia arizonensis TaxID=1141647 RepID=UPI0006D0B490|nr:hypothetical protein [Nocardia arizonensis]
MSPLAHAAQVLVVAAALVVVLGLLGAQAIADRGAEFEEYLDIVDDEVDYPEPGDPAGEWDLDEWDPDYRAGVA